MFFFQIGDLRIRKNLFECLVKNVLFVDKDIQNQVDVPFGVRRVRVILFNDVPKAPELTLDIGLAIFAYRFQQI